MGALLTPEKAEQLKYYYESQATPQQRAAIRRYLGSLSFYNFVKIYLPHHFSLSLEQLNKVKYSERYWAPEQKQQIAGKVLINKTNEETFKVFGQIFKRQQINRVLIKPRGTGKSTEVQGLVIWLLAYQIYHYFLYGSGTLSEGWEKLADIRQEIESNDLLQNDFPHLIPGKTKLTNTQIGWTQHGITFQDMKLHVISYPKGRGKKFKNYRPEIVIFDDLDDDNDVLSPDVMKKRTNWFERVILSLGGMTDLSILIVGTLFDERALINRAAIGEIGDFQVSKISLLDETGNKSNWPEIYPFQRLMDIKNKIGSFAFSSEYLNEPIPEGGKPFTKALIEKYAFDIEKVEIKDKSRMIIFADLPAGSGNDYMGLITVYLDYDNIYYVVDAVVENEKTPLQRQEFVFNYAIAKGVSILGIEKNNQELFIEQLQTRFVMAGIPIIVEPIHHGSTANKQVRMISLLQPLIEAGRLRFRKDYQKDSQSTYTLLIEQLLQIPQGKHDDAPDALAGCIEVFHKYYLNVDLFIQQEKQLNKAEYDKNDGTEVKLNTDNTNLQQSEAKTSDGGKMNTDGVILAIRNEQIKWERIRLKDDSQFTVRYRANYQNGLIQYCYKKDKDIFGYSDKTTGDNWNFIPLKPFEMDIIKAQITELEKKRIKEESIPKPEPKIETKPVEAPKVKEPEPEPDPQVIEKIDPEIEEIKMPELPVEKVEKPEKTKVQEVKAKPNPNSNTNSKKKKPVKKAVKKR